MFKNNTNFAINMKNKLDLSEAEIKYLLWKSHQFKLKEILLSHLQIKDNIPSKEPNKPVEDDKKEEIQQSLFDF
jgi:hypothetical protein